MMKLRCFLTVLLCCAFAYIADAQVDSTTLVHRVSFDYRPAVPTQHHDFLRGGDGASKPLTASASVHLQYSFQFPEGSRLREMMPTAYQGIGGAKYTFFSHKDFGTPAALYVFQGAQIAQLARNLSLDYEWNFGVSAGWHQNLVVSTKVNAYINLGLMVSWRPAMYWRIFAGLDMTHFSNGDTTLPNVGMNTIGARFGVLRMFESDVPSKLSSLPDWGFCGDLGRYAERGLGGAGIGRQDLVAGSADRSNATSWYSNIWKRTSIDVILCGNTNAETLNYKDREYKLDGKFAVVAFHLNPLYRVTRNFLVGPSIDVQYNEGVNLLYNVAGVNPVTDVIKFHRPPLAQQLAAGLSLRAELQAPVFAVNIGVGHNVIYKGPELGGFYYIAALKTFVAQGLFLHVGLKICDTESSNNLLLGLGYRF